MALATTPAAASRRSVGSGRNGSSSAELMKPSRLMNTTWFVPGRVAGACAAVFGVAARVRAITATRSADTDLMSLMGPMVTSAGSRGMLSRTNVQSDLSAIRSLVAKVEALFKTNRLYVTARPGAADPLHDGSGWLPEGES